MSLQRSARFAIAALALLALFVLLRNFNFPLPFRVALAGLVVLAAVRPFDALLVAAAAGPFARLLAELLGSPPFRGFESVMLAFAAGWLLHPPPADRGPASRRVLFPAALMMAVIAASIVTLLLQLRAADAASFQRTLADLRLAFLWTADITGVIEGVNVIVGIVTLLAVVELTEREPGRVFSLLKVMAGAAVAAAVLSLLLAAGIAVPSALARQAAFGKVRYAATIPDVNAAGSYFVLMLGLAGGMAASAIGRQRLWWTGAVVATLAGLGLTGSRSALAAALLVAVAGASWLAVSRGWRARASVPLAGWALIALLVVIAAVTFVQSPLLAAAQMRRDFTVTSIRMIEERPAFGIGMGRYYHASLLALTPWLAALYGQEHAHNYFLQIAAELGIVGVGVLVWLFYTALRPGFAALRDRSRDYVSAGLLAGCVAYLITCVAGHPLLIQEAGFPFWMALGLALTASRSPRGPGAGSIARGGADPGRPQGGASSAPASVSMIACGLACLMVFASIPFRLEPPRLRLRAEQDGFGPWLTDREGKRYRESHDNSSLFVGPEVTAIELPLRRVPGLQGRPRLTVVDQEPNFAMHRTVVTDSWTLVPIALPGADPLMPYQRINLSVFDGDALIENPRASGVAVGEVNIVAVRE